MPSVTVLLFARCREVAGVSAIEIPFEPTAPLTPTRIRAWLTERFPEMVELIAHSIVAVNQEYHLHDQPIQIDDEVALIPPVSGG